MYLSSLLSSLSHTLFPNESRAVTLAPLILEHIPHARGTLRVRACREDRPLANAREQPADRLAITSTAARGG